MKDYTIEQKAKAYNEAFDRAKVIYQGRYKPDTAATIAEVLQNVFPELAESEDDRIRKSLIDLVKCNERSGYTLLNNVSTSSMLAWLEKQNSNSIKWNKNTKDNKPQVNHSVLMQTIYGIAEGEWRGENWYQYRWAGIIKDSEVIAWMELSNIERLNERKYNFTGIIGEPRKATGVLKEMWDESKEDPNYFNDISELTEDDIRIIDNIMFDINNELACSEKPLCGTFYKEVLKRFNEVKEK